MANPAHPSVQAFLEGACDALASTLSRPTRQALTKIGPVSRIIGPPSEHGEPTVLRAGYKVNVVPQTATAEIDGGSCRLRRGVLRRARPGARPGVTREIIHSDIAVQTTRTATCTTL